VPPIGTGGPAWSARWGAARSLSTVLGPHAGGVGWSNVPGWLLVRAEAVTGGRDSGSVEYNGAPVTFTKRSGEHRIPVRLRHRALTAYADDFRPCRSGSPAESSSQVSRRCRPRTDLGD
jgi:hypothetical protein